MECKNTDGFVFDSYTATPSDGGVEGPTPQDLLDRATNEWSIPPASSIAGPDYYKGTDAVNYLSLFIIPMGTVLFWKSLRRRKR